MLKILNNFFISFKRFLYVKNTRNFIKRFPIAYHVVDACIYREVDGRIQILLVQKHSEVNSDKWRFVGGFMEVTDASCEDAAIREVKEETGLEVSHPAYITSMRIEDRRYVNSRHKVFTSFYALKYTYGETNGLGYDDIAKSQWFYLDELNENHINTIHQKLFEYALNFSYKL